MDITGGYYKTESWYKINMRQFPDNYFIIGWRKRVIQIEFHGPRAESANLDTVFTTEDVTKGYGNNKTNYIIHAWGKEKAVEYIDKIIATTGVKYFRD